MTIDTLRGVWLRTVLRVADAPPDHSSFVCWLQGRSFFADLRQPVGRPSFDGIECLRQLKEHHFSWLARQQGFAGILHLAGDIAEWRRDIDFCPPSGVADRGKLVLKGDILEETGTEADYFEEWRRERASSDPILGLKLKDGRGRDAYLVRLGDAFIYARSRAENLPLGASLPEYVAAVPNLTGLFWTKGFDRNRLGKEPIHAEEEV